MRISIVTISYNQGAFLDAAIQSVLNQDHPDTEYIVVDPGSRDSSRGIIEQYRSRIAHVILEPDEGPADGLNKGFALATGDVYGYLNADDLYLPGTLSKVARLFAERPHTDVLSAHCHVVDGDGAFRHRAFSNRFDLTAYSGGFCVLIQPSTFFRRRCYEATHGFNPANPISWDAELAVDMALAGARFDVVQEYWSCFRVHAGTLTASQDRHARHERELRRIAARLGRAQPGRLRRRCLRAMYWVSQPWTLVRRLLDGVVHPSRLV